MKLIYSHLKKFLPDLNLKPQQLRDDLTMIGHFANYYQEIDNHDFVIDLDIKVNRGDALGYYGLARDLSVYYQLTLNTPPSSNLKFTDYNLPITIRSEDVRRVMAAKITGVTVQKSPQWLISFLEQHGINTINNIVDLTNYVMFIYGIPNHAFDTAKTGDNLIWENKAYPQFTTLDGSNYQLTDQNLVISNGQSPLCLSFIGGQSSGIDNNSRDVILEMATYRRSRVRRDSRSLKITTEAGTRLEKDLDSNLIPQAFNHLLSLILEFGGGEISSSLFDHYPQLETPPKITYNQLTPSVFSGIEIPVDFGLDCLARIGCTLTSTNNPDTFLVVPPTIRRDLNLEEDLIEEVVRFWGYQKIPTSKPLSPQNLPDITPKILYLIEELKDKLIALGYDEVRTWPLVSTPLDPKTAIQTQNSINSEVTVLRQSVVQSLKYQLDQYTRYKLPNPQFFEISKVFSRSNNHYHERYSLGIYHHSSDQLAKDLKSLNLPAQNEGNFAEISLDNLSVPGNYTPKDHQSRAIELQSQIITLDANVESDLPPEKLIEYYTAKIDPNHLWQIIVADRYQNRYTLRVSYFNTDSETAKNIHFKAFDIK